MNKVCYMIIYTGLIPKGEAEVILRWITHAHFCGEGSYCHVPAFPSTDLEVSYFKPRTYWRGPVWINTNWMIWQGLLKYGFRQEAELIKQGVLELAENLTFSREKRLIMILSFLFKRS
jgi:Glycosyl hydrolase family 63 C-terminal domain